MDTSSPRGSTSDDSSLVDEYNAWRQKDSHSIKLREVLSFRFTHCQIIILSIFMKFRHFLEN